MAQYTRPPVDPALVHEALRPYPNEPPDMHLDQSAKLNATIATLEQCQRDFKLKVLSRALAEQSKLDDSYRHPSDEESASSDGETKRRNNVIVRALRTSRPSHSGPPQVNPMARSSRPNMRDISRAGGHSANTAQLIEDTVWKLDAYDNQPKQTREKYYAYKEWSLRNEGAYPKDGDVGGKPAAEHSAYQRSTTGSTNYDASRDPRLQR